MPVCGLPAGSPFVRLLPVLTTALLLLAGGGCGRSAPPESKPATPLPPSGAAPSAAEGPDTVAPAATPDEHTGTVAPSEPAGDGRLAAEPTASGPPAGPSAVGPHTAEIEARAKALVAPRDVLEVFLTTRQPLLRHALLFEAARERITPEGLQTFYTDTPGLLDLALPLLPTDFEARSVKTPPGTAARFLVRARGRAGESARRVAYYTLVEENGACRIVWDRRLVALAHVALARGQYRKAEALASEILGWSPACADCEEVLFWAQSRRVGGREAWARAGVHARRAVQLEPEIASHHNALGVYYRNQRMYQSADRALHRALALDPDSPAAGNLALLLEYQSRGEEALKLADDYVKRHPAELWGHLTRCRLLKRLDRYEDAVRACRTALDLRQPTDELAHVDAAHYLLAYSLFRLGKPKEALPEIEKALEYRPDYWLYVELKEQIASTAP